MRILSGIEKSFGTQKVLHGVDLELAPSGITCLLGASGCGKSTLLRIVAGLENADIGTIHALPEDCAMVFQDPRLLPWLTVRENLRLALPGLMPRREASALIEKTLTMVHLSPDTAHVMPRELSGGMAQRVGVARALLRSPRILLMDEPFAALDALTRSSLQDMLRELTRESLCLFVTHDISEAFRVAKRICVMHEGRIAHVFDENAFATRDARVTLRRRIVNLLGLREKEQTGHALPDDEAETAG